MKHIVVPDLHGKDCWKAICVSSYDKVIFLGDYVDHWDQDDVVILANLLEIIELKKSHPDQVELLLGNHDVQYLYCPHFRCSGYRPHMQPILGQAFAANRELFRVAYQKDNYLFTHAGVTNHWYQEFMSQPLTAQIRSPEDSLADLLNKADHTHLRHLLHQAGWSRGGYGWGGISWADRSEMLADMLEGHHQVVGHSIIPEVEVRTGHGKSVSFTDVLDSETFFYEIDC